MRATPAIFLSPKAVYRLVGCDLQKVEKDLREIATSSIRLVDDVNQYLHSGGGKRLRPALLLLVAKLCGFEDRPAIRLGAVVELIHVATLVHDDIIDNAKLRRGQPSVNARWGNQVTVLMGDWLYMTSFRTALELRNFQVLDLLIDITRKMVAGELMQLEQHNRVDISVDEYLAICSRKTAYLFSGCSRLGGILGQAEPGELKKLALYGRSLGMAFQLIDDLLDYTSEEAVLGKPVLKDLEEGKITLPIIHLMQRADEAECEFIRNMVRTQNFSEDNKKRVIHLAKAYRTLDDLEKLANQYAEEARMSLLDFQDSIYRDALLQLPKFVVGRKK